MDICPLQSSEFKDRRVEVDPSALRFHFELDKQISVVLQPRNKSDDFVKFRVKVNRSKYFTRPDKGVMAPWSKSYVVATMQAQEHAPPGMQCSNMFVVRSTTATEGMAHSRRTKHSSLKTEGEVQLPVVYVAALPELQSDREDSRRSRRTQVGRQLPPVPENPLLPDTRLPIAPRAYESTSSEEE